MGGFGDAVLLKLMRDITTQIPKVIDLAEKYNLPVNYLRYVVANYGKFYKFDDSKGASYTDTIHNEVNLRLTVFEEMSNLNPTKIDSETASIETFYHEMTHAYLDLKEEEWPISELIKESENYYTGAKLQDGGEVWRPYQAVQEAAGMYVGHRVSTYWNALESLHWLRDNYAVGIDPLKYSSSRGSVKAIENTYDKAMSREVFGYQQGIFTEQISINKAIYHRLKHFCDMTILENKIKSKFSDLLKEGTIHTNKFKALTEEINKLQQIWFNDNSAKTNRLWV